MISKISICETADDVRAAGRRAVAWRKKMFAGAVLEPRVAMFKKALDAPYIEKNGVRTLAWPEGAELLWGGEPGYECPGYPLCKLPNCLAKRYPTRLTW